MRMISSTDILCGKILIVDDQEANLLLLERLLRGAGYVSIQSTQDPRQVCALHLRHRFDLILLDLQMPEMDGFQVLEALKELEPDGYLPVLVITAQPGHKLRALQSGAKDFISKPFELTEVLVRVHTILEARLLHTKLRSSNDQLQQQVWEQTRLLSISHTLASTLELQPGLILDQLRELVAYSQGGLFVLADAALVPLALRCEGRPGVLPEAPAPLRIPLKTPESLLTLFNAHQPIRIAELQGDDPQAQFLRALLAGAAGTLLAGMQSWMWVPLAVKGRLIGGIGVAAAGKNYFTAHHADLAQSVANQAALTLANAELYGDAQKLAVLEERQRLAHNLHDAVNQSLFSAGLIAEVLPRLWERNPQEARRSLEDLRRLTRGALAEMRALLAELRPATLTDSNLGDLLYLLGNAFTGRTNLPVEVILHGEGSLPPEPQVAFYRIGQEALNNIAKHAGASRVEIRLDHTPAGVELCIHDDGRGFVTSELSPSGHYGLSMMRERAEAVGAALTVTSRPGAGTQLMIRWERPAREIE
jgi:two-component system nitrate/nitrite sensor histidine kinase NarX